MRTTLNLDGDVASRLKDLARREGRSLSRVANDLIRAGFRLLQTESKSTPYRPTTFDSGRPKIDVTDVAAALERLEAPLR